MAPPAKPKRNAIALPQQGRNFPAYPDDWQAGYGVTRMSDTPEREPSIIDRALSLITNPVGTITKPIQDALTEPNLEQSPNSAYIKGAIAGGLEGLGNVSREGPISMGGGDEYDEALLPIKSMGFTIPWQQRKLIKEEMRRLLNTAPPTIREALLRGFNKASGVYAHTGAPALPQDMGSTGLFASTIPVDPRAGLNPAAPVFEDPGGIKYQLGVILNHLYASGRLDKKTQMDLIEHLTHEPVHVMRGIAFKGKRVYGLEDGIPVPIDFAPGPTGFNQYYAWLQNKHGYFDNPEEIVAREHSMGVRAIEEMRDYLQQIARQANANPATVSPKTRKFLLDQAKQRARDKTASAPIVDRLNKLFEQATGQQLPWDMPSGTAVAWRQPSQAETPLAKAIRKK